jgi:Zn-dependent peptidase ImmA (M78 family)
LNPTNSAARESTDIMHELSHLLRNHEPSQIILSSTGNFAMRSFDAKQEDEANWLGGALLLPRIVLVECMEAGMTSAEIADRHGVSMALTDYRLRMTGVERQFALRKPRRAR